MIELNILNSDFEECGTVDDFSSLILTRKYYVTGGFEITCSAKYFQLFMNGEYICSQSFKETGIIQNLSYNKDKNNITIKGKFLEELLSGRIISDIVSGSKTPENWAKDWITNYCISPTDLTRKINKISTDKLNKNIGSIVPLRTRGDDILTKIRDIATPQECGFRLLYNYQEDKIYPEIWQGLDRSENQIDNSTAIFSDNEETASISSYEFNKSDLRNFAFVAGEGDGDNRTIVTVDHTNNQSRSELWVDARDLQKEDNESDQSYKDRLVQRGIEKLSDYICEESAEFSALPTSSLIYKKDYDLGDLCSLECSEIGIKYDARIEEIEECWEDGKYTVTPTFGKSPATILKKLERKMK